MKKKERRIRNRVERQLALYGNVLMKGKRFILNRENFDLSFWEEGSWKKKNALIIK